MNGKTTLFIDQYGSKIFARTIAELRELAGGGKVSKQYIDGEDGKAYHTGYVIGKRWFTAYVPIRKAA